MCETCGCGSDDVRITNLQTNAHVHLHTPEHAHAHDRDHGHSHDHGHTHDNGSHSHRHAVRVTLEADVLAKNDRLAEQNRGWFAGRGVLALNLMSSPGAGKTTLLERTLREKGQEFAIEVIEGDQATLRDAERIRAAGGRVVQINTGAGCHLDAAMLAQALRQLNPPQHSMLLIENVGNLVCPALFDLGEAARVVIASVTEGEDKPLKYPHMFRRADLILLSKIDLLPHVPFDIRAFHENARQANPRARVIEVSVTGGQGLPEWYQWLAEARRTVQ